MKYKDNVDKFIIAHMKVAHIYAQLSTAIKAKVGAILVKDGRILSIGYNGTPSGWSNECEYIDSNGILKTKPEVLHAEQNLLMKIACSNESSKNSYLFCTHSPCLSCSKLIYQAGIDEVYYYILYSNKDGIEFLEKCGIKCEKVDLI